MMASRNNPQQSSNHLLSQSMRGRKGAHVAGPLGKLLMSITKRPRRQAAIFLPGSALYGEPAKHRIKPPYYRLTRNQHMKINEESRQGFFREGTKDTL
jgi:hypothetical protein